MKSIIALQLEHDTETQQLTSRIKRAADFHATRSYFPLITASEVLNWIRTGDKRVKHYIRCNPWNPRFTPDPEKNWVLQSHHYRWIENVHDAGLRCCGFADEINRSIQHTGWYSDPHCDSESYRGIVCQLPARNGFPQYIYGYADSINEHAALLDFDIIEGALGGTEHLDMGELESVASHADDMARICAEHQKEYQATEYAKTEADEKREEAKEKHAALQDYIKDEHIKIQNLYDKADDLIDNPWQLFK